MALRETPRYAFWLIVFGIIAPLLGYASLSSYNPAQGLFWNLFTQSVDIPFLHKPNPLVCMSQGVSNLLADAFTFFERDNKFSCNEPVRVLYSHILLLSLASLIVGVYYQVRGIELADVWPTEWTPFSEANVQRRRADTTPEIADETKHKP
jgi:hypothetical protein